MSGEMETELLLIDFNPKNTERFQLHLEKPEEVKRKFKKEEKKREEMRLWEVIKLEARAADS